MLAIVLVGGETGEKRGISWGFMEAVDDGWYSKRLLGSPTLPERSMKLADVNKN